MPWLVLLVAATCCAATGAAYRLDPSPATNALLPRRAMVLAPVGDYGQWPTWVTGDPCGAQFDLGVVYYGNDSFFSCPECKFVWRARGPKWRLLYQVLNSPSAWRQVQGGLVGAVRRRAGAAAPTWRQRGKAPPPMQGAVVDARRCADCCCSSSSTMW